MKKSLGKRLISGVTSALLAVSAFAQSAIPIGELSMLRAKAASNLDGSNEIDDVTLLVGTNPQNPDGKTYTGLSTVQEAIAQYGKDYALGIASQFSVFTFGDFNVNESDAEGRTAVGGDFIIETPDYGGGSNYAVGKGDFLEKTPLDELLNNSQYAHVILNGEIKNGGFDDTYYEDGKEYGGETAGTRKDKIIDINKNKLPDGYDFGKVQDKNGPGTWQRVDKSQIYVAELIDFAALKDELAERSKVFASKPDQFKVALNGETLTLTYTGGQADTVYCTLDADEQELFRKAKYIKYENIPQLSSPRIGVDNKGAKEEWKYAFIVINVEGEKVTVADNDIYTYINGELISKNWQGNNDGSYKDKIPGLDYSSLPADNPYVDNNHIGVTSLLYNYYEATDLALGKNFQGTIFAPHAYAHDGSNGRGHLSGALIADRFKGGTEFGYRPFTGPSSLLGISSKYSLDIYKVDQDGDPITDVLLEGADFELVPLTKNDDGSYAKDKNGNYIADGDTIKFTVSESGKLEVDNVTPGEYLIREKKPPKGYAKDETTRYFIRISEPDSRKATYSVPLKDMQKEYTYVVTEEDITEPDEEPSSETVNESGNEAGGETVAADNAKVRSARAADPHTIEIKRSEVDDSYIPAMKSTKTYTYTVDLDGINFNDHMDAVVFNCWDGDWLKGKGTLKFYDVDEITENTVPLETRNFTSGEKWLEVKDLNADTQQKTKKVVLTLTTNSEINFSDEYVKNTIVYIKDGDWNNNSTLNQSVSADSPVIVESPITRYYKKYDESKPLEEDQVVIALASGEKVLGHKYQVQPEVSPIDYDNVTIGIYKNKADENGKFADDPFKVTPVEHTYSGLNNISNEIKNKDNIYVFDVSVDKTKPVEGEDGLTRYEAVINQVKMTDANGKTTTLKKGDEGFDSFKIHTVTDIKNADGTEIKDREPLMNLTYNSKFIPMENGVYTVTDKGTATINGGMGGNKTVDNAFYELKFDKDGNITSARYAVPTADMVRFGPVQTVGAITTDLVRTDGSNDDTWDEWYGFDPADGKLKRWTPHFNTATHEWEPLGTAVRVVDEECGVYRINGKLYVAVYDEGNTMIYELAEVNFEPKTFGPVTVPAVTTKKVFEDKAELVVNEYVITIDDDVAESNINLTYAFTDENAIKLENEKTEVPITVSKRALGSEEELGGVTLKISVDEENLDDFKEKFSEVKVEQNSQAVEIELNTDDEVSVTFVTSDEFATKIKGLPDGHYILSEVEVPDKSGYIIADPIKFEVLNGVIVDVTLGNDKENYFNGFEKDEKASEEAGKTVYVKHYENELYEYKVDGTDTYLKETTDSLIMIDAHETLSVSKVDINGIGNADATELTGADIEFRRINVKIEDNKVKIVNAADYAIDRWISGDKPHVIKPMRRVLNPAYETDKTQAQYIYVPAALANGYYRFREISAPDGYQVVSNVYVQIKDYKIVDILEIKTDEATGERIFVSAERKDAVKDADGNLTIGDTASELVISKNDTETNVLAGAEIKISLDLSSVKAEDMEAVKVQFDKVTVEQGSDKFDKETKAEGFEFVNKDDEKSITFISSDVDAVFKNLPDGKYIFHEVTPPEGFQQASDITFTVTNGVITEIVLDETADDVKDGVYDITEEDEEGNVIDVERINDIPEGQTTDTVIMVDRAKGVLHISKADMTGKNKIAGARMKLEKAELNADKTVTVGESVVSWTSSDKDLRDVKIEEGYYLLTEVAAPTGYTVIEAKILVYVDNNANISEVYTVDGDNKATLVDEKNEVNYVETDGDAIIIKDKLSSIHVSKKVVGGSEISGARLRLKLDTSELSDAALESTQKAFAKVTVEQGTGESKKTGNAISGYNKVASGKDFYVTFNSAGMIAGKVVDTVINGLPDGKYILEEIAVPKDDDDNDKYIPAEPINIVVEKGIIKSIEIDEKDKDNYAEGENVVGTSQVTGVVMRDATTTTVSTTTTTTETTTTTTTTTEEEVEDTTTSTSTSTSTSTETTTTTTTTETTTTTTTTETTTTTTTQAATEKNTRTRAKKTT
ncbi:MAG: choice-of-anchor A family protein, partial [Ruminococcus sp.]|nr:choice-of-anchor A family protein [Ruminococcus sp.]